MKREIRFGIIGLIVSAMLLASMPSVSAELFGDANEDTRINMQDVTKVERMILNYDDETTSADANRDDDITMQDVTCIELIILERVLFPGGSLNAVMIFGPKDNTLDPAYKWTGWYVRKAGIYETLFKYNDAMELTPELATGHTQVSDTVWDVQLREGVKFHDGTPFNADAVVYSIGRVMDVNNSRHSSYDHIASVVAQDDYTVRITTTDPYAPAIASLTDPLVSIVSADTTIDLASNPVGTGPFMYVDNVFGAWLSVERNEDYWGGGVKLEDVTLTYNKVGETRATMLESGDVDMARGLPYPLVSTIEGKSNLDVVSKETMRAYFMFVNTAKAPLDDVRVRQAINYAIDRDEVVDVALEGVGGVSAKGVFPSIFPWANDELAGYPHNQATALALLADAGITPDGDGTLQYNGADFTLDIKTYTSRAAMQPSVEVIQSQLDDIGIVVTTEFTGSSTIKADMVNGTYDLAFYSYGVAPSGDPDYYLTAHFDSTAGFKENGWTGYTNTAVNSLLADARAEMDPDTRKDYYDEATEIIIDESPEMFIFHENELLGYNTKVIGYEIYPNEISFLTKNMYIGR